MMLESGAKFEEKVTCGLEKYWDFYWVLLSKIGNV